ncbi:MAG: DUF2807 domain-containing protein [Bacteroidales bacterium]|nr:DUF2807 domain-containing protein [Bacteroidales bacterium]
MKKIVLTCIIILAISVLHAQSNGNSDMDVTAVDIDLPGNIIIKQSTGTQMWSVKANNHNYSQYVHAEVADGKLLLYLDDAAPKVEMGIQVEIQLPVLKELSLHGTCDVLITTRNEPQLSVRHYGTGNCNLVALNIGKFLELHNNGTGSIKIVERLDMETGESIPFIVPIISTESLLLHNSGTGNISLESCSASSVVINNQGTGDVIANMLNSETEVMTLENKGTGELNLLNLNVKQLGLKNIGTGNVKLNGKAESLRLYCVGIGDVKAPSLVAKTAHITNSGTGYIKANVTDTAYISNQCDAKNVEIIGGGKVVRECF